MEEAGEGHGTLQEAIIGLGAERHLEAHLRVPLHGIPDAGRDLNTDTFAIRLP